ncbi:ATP-dependent DNA helicase DDX11-like [Macrobrachium nipponense]|uniref:ATP-dependent DNA helicase DDX11-like n=1 Tax=Macrobrachium nipponense TaxID=159736 RepID=UPI0030C7D09C
MKKIKESEKMTVDDNDPDWFSAAAKKQEGQEEVRRCREELKKLEKQEERVSEIKQRRHMVKKSSVQRVDDEFEKLFQDLHEVKENVQRELNSFSGADSLSSEESMLLLDDYDSDQEDTSKKEKEEDDEDDGCLKIYYCSRTHSQLSQFVREVQKTVFGEDARVVSLASRQNLCVNEAVTNLGNLSLINDRCTELQRGKKGRTSKVDGDDVVCKKKKVTSGCPYYKNTALEKLADNLLLEVQDIEQMVSLGKKTKSCPYYGARYAVKDSQLVILPYNTLLHKGTREACQIKLKGNIVIVDEGHNLLETIANIHSVFVSKLQFMGAHAQLSQYMQRYEKRLSPRNLLYIKQILFFINSQIKLLNEGRKDNILGKIGTSVNSSNDSGAKNQFSRMYAVHNFMSETLIDNLNIYKLIQYIEKSKIAHKLHSFSQKFEGTLKSNDVKKPGSEASSTSAFLSRMTCQNSGKDKSKENITPANDVKERESENPEEEIVMGSPLMQVTEFLRALLHSSADGRVVVSVGSTNRTSSVKYLLLNPASQFHDIVKECRSIIVAGGTMHPMSEFRNQLFLSAGADPERVREFSCGHVIPGDQIMPVALSNGPTNTVLDFTYQNRGNPKVLDELGRVLVNLCTIVPGGIVCFLPSYDYEQKVFDYFLKTGVIDRLSGKKKVFREPKKSNQLDGVLNNYATIIRQTSSSATGLTGAILFSVVGGKMSEGINFSDALGRCVVMVGLPYPNTQSPELKEKIDFLNKNVSPGPDGKSPGSVFYENLCFKAVNQSIGRAIRHRNDYASIILLDHRYNRPSSVQALPKWISIHLHQCEKFGQAFGLIRKFFTGKRIV